MDFRSRVASRSGRRRTFAIAVAALLMLVAGVATAIVRPASPEPHDVDQVQAIAEPMADELFEPGWRQRLRAEKVECVAGENRSDLEHLIETWASDFPLEDTLTRSHLVDECLSGNDRVHAPEHTASEASVCVGNARYPKAVVVADGVPCSDPVVGLEALSDEDLRELNRLRAIEVSLLAMPEHDECPTASEAEEWAQERLSDLGVDLRVRVFPEGEACYRPVTYWQQDEVIVQGLGPQPE